MAMQHTTLHTLERCLEKLSGQLGIVIAGGGNNELEHRGTTLESGIFRTAAFLKVYYDTETKKFEIVQAL